MAEMADIICYPPCNIKTNTRCDFLTLTFERMTTKAYLYLCVV